MGRLTRDPDIRHTQGDNPVTVSRFTVAVDRRFRKNGAEQQADFISCVAFRQQAEFMEKYMHKGTKVVLSGSIQTGSYTNREGQKVYTTDVVVDEIEFAESKKAADSYDANSQGYVPPQGNAGGFSDGDGADDGFMNVPDGIDEELPFT